MVIGLCTVRFNLPSSSSLKDKRQICQSLTVKIRKNYNVAIAEIGDLNSYKWATMAFVSVNTEKNRLNSTLSRVIEYINKEPSLVVEKCNIEIY